MRRSHHSISWSGFPLADGSIVAGYSKAPRIRRPCISMARKAWKMAAGSRFRVRANELAVVGPRICNHP